MRAPARGARSCVHLDHNQHSFEDGDPTCQSPASKFNKAATVAQTLQPRGRGYVCVNFNVSCLRDK